MVKFNYPEGATPLNDYSGLIPRGILTQDDLNRVEAESIFEAQKKYLGGKINQPSLWFTIENLKIIHKAMFGNVWTWAGEFRKSKTSIGIEPYLIPNQLAELCSDVRAWSQDDIELTFLEQSARVHHRLVYIHPFENGNGRFSRLVADRYLMAYGCSHPQWPSLQDDGTSRKAYIQSLKEADHGNYDPLLSFMRTHGAHDPFLSELLGFTLYKKMLSPQRMLTMVRALLRLGCDVNETQNNGHCPLQLAIRMNSLEIARLLIKHGADSTVRDKSGYNAFESAINRGRFEIAKIIHDAGYPYKPRVVTSLKLKHEMRYKFDMIFF